MYGGNNYYSKKKTTNNFYPLRLYSKESETLFSFGKNLTNTQNFRLKAPEYM